MASTRGGEVRDAAEGEKKIYIYMPSFICTVVLHKISLFSIYLYIDIKIASIFTVLH